MTNMDSPWFVRRCGRGCDIMPNALQGWLLTGLYVAIITVIAERLARHGTTHLTIVIIAIVSVTALYVGIAWRMSAPAPTGSRGTCKGGRA